MGIASKAVSGAMVSDDEDRTGLIVVGVDGSDSSKHAVRWAKRHADNMHGRVEAVMAWTYPPYTGLAQVTDTFDYAAHAERMLDETIREALGSPPPANFHTSVAHGNAAKVLIDASEGAELLVIGNRGHGGFTEMLLGSVGQHCTQHATCPVVVVR
jgi:nucleotide-binding universal stress UspA family protein